MLERQLADLLVQIGLDHHVDIEAIVAEMAALRLPTFVDEAAFRNSLLDSIESQLRRQTDEKIHRLRQQLEVPTIAQGRVQAQPKPAYVTPPPGADDTASGGADSHTLVEAEDLPQDATMVWKSRDQS